jgi:hypothetical protein
MKISKVFFLILLSLIVTSITGCNPPKGTTDNIPKSGPALTAKPVIYLYPTSSQTVSVELDYKGKLTCTYPEYEDE